MQILSQKQFPVLISLQYSISYVYFSYKRPHLDKNYSPASNHVCIISLAISYSFLDLYINLKFYNNLNVLED